MASDLTLNSAAVLGAPAAKTREFNQGLIKIQETIPSWFEVGAAEYRRMRDAGETPLPPLVLLPDAVDEPIPSRDAGRNINLRILRPDGDKAPAGVYFHIHGGGWVLQSERSQDKYLKALANGTGCVVASVGYRLAPEHPFPAGPNDCYDVAEYLVDHASERYGAQLAFVGGESAGGHLSSLVVLHLLDSRPQFRFKGAVLNYGCFNLANQFPSAANFSIPLVLTGKIMEKYLEAFLPAPYETADARAHPSISPFFGTFFTIDSETQEIKGREGVPPAIFMCGTHDPLLDDTFLMAARWSTSGAETKTRIWKGMPHGFNLFAQEMVPESAECNEEICAWARKHL